MKANTRTRKQSGCLAGSCQYCHGGYLSFPGSDWCLQAWEDRLTYLTLKWRRNILHPSSPPSAFFTVSLGKVRASSPQMIKWEEDGPPVSYSLLLLDSSVSRNHQEGSLKCRLLGSIYRSGVGRKVSGFKQILRSSWFPRGHSLDHCT